MRTTLDLDIDIMDMARSLADSRQISIGKAVSYLVRRGATAPAPLGERNGFRTFVIQPGTARFGLDEVQAAQNEDDKELAGFFAKNGPAN